MKRKYYKPSMNIEVFEASEYIAACWAAECNVNTPYWGGAKIYTENNGIDGCQKGDLNIQNISNRGCGEKVKFKLPEGQLPQANYMYDSNGKKDGGDIFKVFRWKDHLVKAEGNWYYRDNKPNKYGKVNAS